jgi:MFS family permease
MGAREYTDKIRDYLSLRGNIPGLVTSTLIEGTVWQIFGLVWQPYTLILGGSITLVGSFMSLWILVNSLLQFFTGELCDSLGRKPLINWYFIASMIGLIISFYAKNWIWLIPSVLFFSIASSLKAPAYRPIFAESVDKNKTGLAFSLLSLTGFVPGIYSQLFAGYFGDNFGPRQVNLLSILLVLVAFLVHYFTVNETLEEKRQVDLDIVITNIKNIFRPRKDLRVFYLLSIFDSFSWALSQGIFVVMMYETFDFTLLEIGALLTVEMVVTTVALIPIGKLVDKYGSVWFLRGSVVFGLITFIGYMLVKNYTAFIGLQVFKGLVFALWNPAFNSLLTKAVSVRERGTIYGNLNGLQGFIVFPAPLIGAYLFDRSGFTGIFTASIVVSVFALIFAFILEIKQD